MELTTLWFILIAVLWAGYFLLEGFDFGVGVLFPVIGRDDADRRTMLNTIGPVWDGNEVWLLVAGGATFAAFPEWYATLFSGFYLPLFLILLALIVRGVAFEYRHRSDDPSRWDQAIFWGSLVPAFLWGVAFANILRGVPLDADHEYTGTLFTLLNPYALLGGVVTLALFTLHGAVFLALKTTGELRDRAVRVTRTIGPVTVVVGGAFLVITQFMTGVPPRWPGRLGVRRERARHRGDHLHPVRQPVPGRDARARPGQQPHRGERGVHAVHAHRDDLGGGDLHADRARVPGLDVLGVPQAAHPDRDAGRALIAAYQG
jgi:cytochrome d ubiquinol oxidase subunit II